MNISRNFLLTGTVFILIGMVLGAWMGATNDHTLAPLHAHINLLGFVLPAIFALVYRAWPAMAGATSATSHFWLHTLGTALLMVLLYLLFTGRIAEDSPLMLLALAGELAIILGVGLFGLGILRNVT
jgi:hypothetical protein